jgi:molybdopterin converting factor small subunit
MTSEATVRLFGPAREAVGTDALRWAIPPDGLRASDLVAGLAKAYPRLAPTLRVSRFLLNDEFLGKLTRRVRPGDEFAVHPPYGGG